MTIHAKSTVRNAMLDTLDDAANGGSSFAVIEIRTGTQPANADAADAGTVLATFTCTDPAFKAASGGSIELNTDTDLTATAGNSGTATHARMKDSSGAVILDGSVGLSGSGAEFIITSTSIVSGQTVTLTSGTVSLPAA